MMLFDSLFKIRDDNYYGVSGLNSELSMIYVYNAFLKYSKSVVVITNSLYEANILYSKLSNYTEKVLFFPMDDFITSEAIAISPELKVERINTINALIDGDKYIVVTNLMGILRYLPNVNVWKKSIINLKKGMNIGREYLEGLLFDIGYERESIVTETGNLGVRGYVLDIFPISESNPVRIEFWGDEIDSIKYFDVESQLSNKEIDEINIYPYSEFLLDEYNEDIDRKQKYLEYYAKDINGLWDYVDNFLCFYYDYNQISEGYRLLFETIKNYDKDNEFCIKTDYMFDIKDIKFDNEVFLLQLDNILNDIKLKFEDKYKSMNIGNFDGNIKYIKDELKKYMIQKKDIIICVPNELTLNRVVNYLSDDIDIVKSGIDEIVKGKVNIVIKNIDTGFIFDNYVVISHHDLFKDVINKKKYKNKFRIGTKINDISNISRGDYIVHNDHGIGIYDELATIVKNGYKKDYIKLIYAGGDVLYIPVEKIDRISKYSSKEGASVKLDSLSNDTWKKKKARVRGRLQEIADSLLKISAERETIKGFAFSEDDENQLLFDSEFDYIETPDQLKAIAAIKKEMEKNHPMDMLLCGDVGYGKTEVAFRAMFKAVNDGKQVAYLCPTTILSNQQYKNALDRFKNFPVNIDLINRYVSNKKQKEIVERLKNGKIDILFGTHRILSNDIEFKDLGLLVVDEEQRFGVTHKEKIKQYKSSVDVLTLSATPIPRTLQMSMSGIRSLALIETAPEERLPIQTYVLAENDSVIKDAIYKELARGGQVFILYNYIDDIEEKANKINKLIPAARVEFAHGRMTKSDLEDKMQDFIDYKFDILVCTTIIETGIDIPNVNTLIIMDADHFGLSQLYQIRGRIGRSNKIGYAYLMYNKHKMLNDIAVKRLNTIKEFTELGSGFKIAMRDLSIRGAGDILGSEQSGFIDTIGIELYLKMLREAVDKLKGDFIEEEKEEKLENKTLIDVETHISDKYIQDEDLKIEIHKMINEVDSMDNFLKIKNELEDRFGRIDSSMEIYMYEEWFEKLANIIKVEKVNHTKTFIDIELSSDMNEKIDGEELFMTCYDISKNFRLGYKNNKIHIILDTVNLDKHFLIYLVNLFDTLIKVNKF
ncbi:MAG: transcription-repair coupling factor [Bacilli bacterium]|nr:transcription-repair coupling factor [Bacilli bacterium]